jgi:hypothetical protein
MKDRVLSSNAYSLLTIGSTMAIEGTNIKLGITYCLLGIILLTAEVFMKHDCNKEEKKN